MSAQQLFRGTPALCPRANGDPFHTSEAETTAHLLDDGWTWPIQVIQSGWAEGTVDGTEPGTPQYINIEAVAQVAAACQSARFGRRSPRWSSEECDPGRIAGTITDGHIEGGRALATLQLFPVENTPLYNEVNRYETVQASHFHDQLLVATYFHMPDTERQHPDICPRR